MLALDESLPVLVPQSLALLLLPLPYCFASDIAANIISGTRAHRINSDAASLQPAPGDLETSPSWHATAAWEGPRRLSPHSMVFDVQSPGVSLDQAVCISDDETSSYEDMDDRVPPWTMSRESLGELDSDEHVNREDCPVCEVITEDLPTPSEEGHDPEGGADRHEKSVFRCDSGGDTNGLRHLHSPDLGCMVDLNERVGDVYPLAEQSALSSLLGSNRGELRAMQDGSYLLNTAEHTKPSRNGKRSLQPRLLPRIEPGDDKVFTDKLNSNKQGSIGDFDLDSNYIDSKDRSYPVLKRRKTNLIHPSIT
ncbi:hypothetical protein F5Y08DRAFT_351325 [Xylaria arbuscula]|nr:hypothetical protein F5Y08DRAFT_351325 [Xylaria arbuscula]